MLIVYTTLNKKMNKIVLKYAKITFNPRLTEGALQPPTQGFPHFFSIDLYISPKSF